MSAVLIFSLLVLFSSGVGHKCDFYFVGNVHYRSHSGDESGSFQGCKKGCYWNGNYTDDGVPACGKCSEIKDEIECVNHIATCQWTKSGKCKSQSCPSIAKARVSLYGLALDDNSSFAREAQYRSQLNLERECIEGSPLEQKYNSLYWEDYKETFNYKYAVWNRGDTCTVPGSTMNSGSGPYRWNVARTHIEATETPVCQKYVGFTYNTASQDCELKDCSLRTTKTACDNEEGCIYISDGGGTVCALASDDSCTRTFSGGNRWMPGVNTSEECESTIGCLYIPGVGGTYNPVTNPITNPITGTREDKMNQKGLYDDDKCLPRCAGFTPGTNTRKDCETLGCTFKGDYSGRQNNRKTTEDIDPCPAERRPPIYNQALPNLCGINTTLTINYVGVDVNTCIDRLYSPGSGCTDKAFTTKEACLNAHSTWNLPSKECRTLASTTRSRCEFLARDAKNYVVLKDLSSHGGNQRPGTRYEDCVQKHYNFLDNLKRENITLWNGETQEVEKYLTPEDHEKIYGYRTPEEYCQLELDARLETCQQDYDAEIRTCHQGVVNQQVNASNDWTRTHVQVKAVRSSCHRLYGCMYSKSNERCSVWAVWAFIFTIVLSTCVVVIAIGVAAVFLLPSLKKSVTPS